MYCCNVCEDYSDCPGRLNCNVARAYHRDPDEWMEGYDDYVKAQKSDCGDDPESDNENKRRDTVSLPTVA